MQSEGHDSRPARGRSAEKKRSVLAAALGEPLIRLVAAVALAGMLGFAATLFVFSPAEWPLLPWLGFTLACAVMVSFPYRVNRPGESYFMDFDEVLLVVSLLYLGPAAIVAALPVGFLLGAMARRISARRLIFNTSARAAALSGAMAVVALVPAPSAQPWGYVTSAVLAAAVYSLINQTLVSRAISLINGTGFVDEFREAVTGVLSRSWPIVVSYGLMVGVASQAHPAALVLGAVPVVLIIAASRVTQQQRAEYLRMTGLYRAAQEMHEARTDEDILRILRLTVRKTLGVDGAMLRATPPYGDELGAWLPNRSCWMIVPAPAWSDTRRQDDAFLQAAASLVEASMERATLVGELERQSLRDPLTNAYNRRYFHQALSAALEAKGEPSGCLVLVDIDHFKVINDTFGHEVGDATLKALVDAAHEIVHVNGVLCRLGGDEFALILPGISLETAVERLVALRQRLAQCRPGGPGRGPAGFQVSTGIAAYPDHGREPMNLLRAADRALYRAKREGRDRIVVLSSGAEQG